MAPPPSWLREWLEAVRKGRIAKKMTIDVAAFEVGGKSKRPWPKLRVEITGARKNEGLARAFGFTLRSDRLAKGAVSYVCGWGKANAALFVRRGEAASMAPPWIVRLQPPAQEAKFYHHLRRGKTQAVHTNDADYLRIVQSLRRLGLRGALDSNGRLAPTIFDPAATEDTWLANLVRTVVLRTVISGLLRKSDQYERWTMKLLGLDELSELDAFRRRHRWNEGQGALAEGRYVRRLEKQLERGFEAFVKHRAAEEGVPLHVLDHQNAADWDSQRPDILLAGHPEDEPQVVIEAKLGHSRDSIRTGLAQAAEYAFHFRNRFRQQASAYLLLGMPPSHLGDVFEDYVHVVAGSLGVGVICQELDQFLLLRHPDQSPSSPVHGVSDSRLEALLPRP